MVLAALASSAFARSSFFANLENLRQVQHGRVKHYRIRQMRAIKTWGCAITEALARQPFKVMGQGDELLLAHQSTRLRKSSRWRRLLGRPRFFKNKKGGSKPPRFCGACGADIGQSPESTVPLSCLPLSPFLSSLPLSPFL